jgi:CheY-like chemotaxis protein
MLVLVVDDHEPNRRLLTMLLETEGYRVLGAGSVAETHQQLESHVPDAILMDVQLPDGDGLDVVAALRADRRMRGVRMYAVTANLMDAVRERAARVGCDGFFEKPLDTDRLFSALREERGR